MDPGDRAAAEDRQAGRLGRLVSDLPRNLSENERRAWRAGWLLGHEEAQAWHDQWEAGVLATAGARRAEQLERGRPGGPSSGAAGSSDPQPLGEADRRRSRSRSDGIVAK